MDEAHKQDHHHHHHVLLPLLQALKKAIKDLQINPVSGLLCQNNTKPAIEALFELETTAEPIISENPSLFINLSRLLVNLRTLLQNLEKLQGFNLRSLCFRPITNYKILQISRAIESEIESCIDREIVLELVTELGRSTDEDEQVRILIEFRHRVSKGFDRDFQELVLRGRAFSVLESVLADSSISGSNSKRVWDEAALVVLALVEFNKDVFVGLVLMGPTIRALMSIASSCSIRVLSSLIRLIKTPLVDEIEANGEIPRLVDLLSSEEEDFGVRVAALNCVFEIGFSGGRREAMLEEGLVKKLVNLQRRMEHESELAEAGRLGESEIGEDDGDGMESNSPCENCIARFVVQIQAGESLEKREKREFKSKFLKMVREASVSDAEFAAIVAEVLWGSSP
ncbi:LOW QUALITY PROTEIN: Coatomer beta subunit [Trema orientale]|uniref:Coatomer beta subunit n=1 Tax=Trema orientale TaxID=63057 RepID=A0A2P5EWF7_TREOI|nr:LOW QUALITY PROTEIN: Coatomer beta subunit [Trema orientale]